MCYALWYVGVTTSNVELTVFRRGELGNVEVGWTTVTSTAPGFTPGSVLPVIGTLQFPSQQNNTTLTLTVGSRIPFVDTIIEFFPSGYSCSASWQGRAVSSQLDCTVAGSNLPFTSSQQLWNSQDRTNGSLPHT